MDKFSDLFSFKGRIGRGTWWIVYLATTGATIYVYLVAIIGMIPAAVLSPGLGIAVMVLTILVGLVLITWAWIATSAKRCHDRGKTGWFQLVGLIPLVGPIWLLVELGFQEGDWGKNDYGEPPSHMV